jgi:hypothetical protein
MVRAAGVILVVAIAVGCGSSSSSESLDADDVAGQRPQDSNGSNRDVNGDIDGDCTPATAFTCVASCASPTPTTLICDDGHWECEHGVDARLCGDAGT